MLPLIQSLAEWISTALYTHGYDIIIRAHAENKDSVVQCRSAHQIARKTSHAAT